MMIRFQKLACLLNVKTLEVTLGLMLLPVFIAVMVNVSGVML